MIEKEKCFVFFRIHEKLEKMDDIDIPFYKKLILFIKYKSNMNLNNSKSPQSSALNLLIDDDCYRVRISTLPSYLDESIVLRIHHKDFNEKIENLLLRKEQATIFNDCIQKDSGLMLITGPTCSGKTTLSYSLLNTLKETGLSIVTIEDPVERYEKGFVQLQINEKAGVNYEGGVKEILRHDPDVIFIGEIRDEMTARSAIRASLTGHKVISTMHAKDCMQAIYRFIEFGLSLLDLEQTMLLVTNQRLMHYGDQKKIILEYLNEKLLTKAFDFIRNGKPFTYKKLIHYIE